MKSLPYLLFGLIFGSFLFVVQGPAFAKKEKSSEAADAKPPFQEVFKKLDAEVRAALKKDKAEGVKELERVGRLLSKDYPKEFMPYAMLSAVARMTKDQEKSVKILNELAALDGSDPKIARLVGQAKGQLKKMQALGKPLDMKFEAVDGRKVDLAKMKGKVVLIDFWATWCGPCVDELPNVKKTYAKLHPKGFEIVGISLDSSEDKLKKFVKERGMPWPQYYDGQGWKNKISTRYGIRSIPAMWLVDKQGNLVDKNARRGLEAKVEKLLEAKVDGTAK